MRKLVFLLCLLLPATFAFGASNGAGKALSKEVLSVKLNILINGSRSLSAVLYDNPSARALAELLKKGAVTISMSDYGGFEKVGDLPAELPRSDRPLNTDAGDLILYLGKRFVIYYDKNSWNFTPLGKIEGVSKGELKKILGAGNITASLSVAER